MMGLRHTEMRSSWLRSLPAGLFLLAALRAPGADPPAQEVWTFDRIDRIGGHATTVLGHPRVIDTPAGKAVEFNGVDDGLQLDVHPLAGAETFTFEAVFRPDGGNAEQRWFHLEQNPASGSDDNSRMLFEIRVIDGQWCLDAFNKSGPVQKALMNRQNLHPLGRWFHLAAVYDGKEFRSYVDGVGRRGRRSADPQVPGRRPSESE